MTHPIGVDRFQLPGKQLQTLAVPQFIAIVNTSPIVATGMHCNLAVYDARDVGWVMVMPTVELDVRTDAADVDTKAAEAAEEILAASGWNRSESWGTTVTGPYAFVEQA
jgi:hypothetical protein